MKDSRILVHDSNLDPYKNYGCGCVRVGTEDHLVSIGNQDYIVLIGEDGEPRVFNVHMPNNFNLHGYGIRWELRAPDQKTGIVLAIMRGEE